MKEEIKKSIKNDSSFSTETRGEEILIEASEHLFVPRYNAEKVWDNINQELGNSHLKLKWVWAVLATAASISLLLMVGNGWFSINRIRTNLEEVITIEWPEGSRVHLNGASLLRYDDQNWEAVRSVYLKGEAYFEVESSQSPFEVTTNFGKISVLGTKFNVYSREHYFKLTCNEGRVSFINQRDTILITAPSAIQIVGGEISSFEIGYTSPAWMEGYFEYHDFPLDLLLDEMENHYAVEIEFTGDIKGQKFNGKLPSDDLDLALEILSYTLDIPVQFMGKNQWIFHFPEKKSI
jgi:ferric-dicitrate binding protein FerR (iron transport regulator)